MRIIFWRCACSAFFCAAVMLPDEHRNIGCRAVRALYQSTDEIMEKSAGIVQNDMRKKKPLFSLLNHEYYQKNLTKRRSSGKIDMLLSHAKTNQWTVCPENTRQNKRLVITGVPDHAETDRTRVDKWLRILKRQF